MKKNVNRLYIDKFKKCWNGDLCVHPGGPYLLVSRANFRFMSKSIDRHDDVCKACRKAGLGIRRVDKNNTDIVYDFRVVQSLARSSNNGALNRSFGRIGGAIGIGIIRPSDLLIKMDLQDWSCMYCKDKITFDTCQLDHIYPIVKGGEHHIDNIAIACVTCNQTKKSSTLKRFCKKMRFDYEEIMQEIADLNHKLFDLTIGKENAA